MEAEGYEHLEDLKMWKNPFKAGADIIRLLKTKKAVEKNSQPLYNQVKKSKDIARPMILSETKFKNLVTNGYSLLQ